MTSALAFVLASTAVEKNLAMSGFFVFSKMFKRAKLDITVITIVADVSHCGVFPSARSFTVRSFNMVVQAVSGFKQFSTNCASKNGF